jgi:hypothetical protein
MLPSGTTPDHNATPTYLQVFHTSQCPCFPPSIAELCLYGNNPIILHHRHSQSTIFWIFLMTGSGYLAGSLTQLYFLGKLNIRRAKCPFTNICAPNVPASLNCCALPTNPTKMLHALNASEPLNVFFLDSLRFPGEKAANPHL